MAVREFADEHGLHWRAWNITPESIHPVTRAEDYLVECYQLGWLVFESASGEQKRRLCPYPAGWDTSSDADLLALLGRAEAVPASKLQAQRETSGGAHGDRSLAAAPEVRQGEPDVTDLRVVRTFRYPGGRFWTVCELARPDDGRPPRLRFAAGARAIDLFAWPRDWPDYPDERLITMLRSGAPRHATSTPDPGTPRRRWDDLPPPRTAEAQRGRGA
jgi:hypothetical protein